MAVYGRGGDVALAGFAKKAPWGFLPNAPESIISSLPCRFSFQGQRVTEFACAYG